MDEITFHPYKKRPKTKRQQRRGLIKRLERQLVVSPKVLRSRLDEIVSYYIRWRDKECLMGKMWTPCNGPVQAGHVLSRRHLATRWDETNIFGQCRSHNYQHTFNPNLYVSWYVKTFGADKYEELVRKSRTSFKPTVGWLQEQIDYFESKLNAKR